MNESEKISIANLLYVNLRRQTNRIIDVQWLVQNAVYAREIIDFAHKQGAGEVLHYADRLEEIVFGAGSQPTKTTVIPLEEEAVVDEVDVVYQEQEDVESANSRPYIGTLR